MTPNNIDLVCFKVNELFNLNIDKQLKASGYRFETFHQIIDIVNNTKYYCIGFEGTDLNFQDRKGLFEVLIKFIDEVIANIPIELEKLESQRQSRDFDDYRHFYDTEALSEKEGKLMSIKNQLIKSAKK